MQIAIGIIIGLLIAIIVVAMTAAILANRAMTARIVQRIRKTQKTFNLTPKGFVFEPPDEAEAARQEIIQKNDREGRDTRLADLANDDDEL